MCAVHTKFMAHVKVPMLIRKPNGWWYDMTQMRHSSNRILTMIIVTTGGCHDMMYFVPICRVILTVGISHIR